MNGRGEHPPPMRSMPAGPPSKPERTANVPRNERHGVVGMGHLMGVLTCAVVSLFPFVVCGVTAASPHSDLGLHTPALRDTCRAHIKYFGAEERIGIDCPTVHQ